MKNILIIYGSTTGNSENLAKYCADHLKDTAKVDIKNCIELKGSYSFYEYYDAYILCVSTWGIDPAGLQEDFEIFWKQLNKNSIYNKKFFLLGLGDNYYPFFAKAIDILHESINENKGIVLGKPMKINDSWEDKKIEITNHLIKALAKV